MGEKKEIKNKLNTEQIVMKGVIGFNNLLSSLHEDGVEPPAEVLMSFVTGYISALMVVGFSASDAKNIGVSLHKTIIKVGGGEGCGECDTCKANKK